MVEEHRHRARLSLQGLGKRAGLNDVAVTIDDAEHARVSLENALGTVFGEFDRGLIEGQCFANARHFSLQKN
ncbi:hypothetical protein D3C87_2068110 [compost metagenome]